MIVLDPTKQSPASIVDELTYSNYAFNRRRSPQITPERWARVFGAQSAALEARFQAEIRNLQ